MKELGEGPDHTFSISLNKSQHNTHNNTHTTHKLQQHALISAPGAMTTHTTSLTSTHHLISPSSDYCGCGRLCTMYTSPSTIPPSTSCADPYAVSSATPASRNLAPSAARAAGSTLSALLE